MNKCHVARFVTGLIPARTEWPPRKPKPFQGPTVQSKKAFDPKIALCVSRTEASSLEARDRDPLLQRWDLPENHQMRRKAVTEYPESCCEDTAGIREMKRRNPAVSLSLKPTHRDIWSPWSKTQTRRGRGLGASACFYCDTHRWIFIRNHPVHQRHLKSTHWTKSHPHLP